MDRDELERRLEDSFKGSDDARAVVARQARDLADSGRIAEDFGYEVTAEDVVAHLSDAPEGHGLVERWNWWVGSLAVTHPSYERFSVRRDVE